MVTMHIDQKIRNEKSNKPIAIKTIFGRVFMGGKSQICHNCVTSNKLNLQNLDILSESTEHEGRASKSLLEEIKHTPSNTNYISHHGVENINRPGEAREIFDAGAKFHSTSLNENLFKGPDLLNSLFGVLIRFWKEEFALRGNIERMFHQTRIHYNDREILVAWSNVWPKKLMSANSMQTGHPRKP